MLRNSITLKMRPVLMVLYQMRSLLGNASVKKLENPNKKYNKQKTQPND